MDKIDWEILKLIKTEKTMIKVSEKIFISQPAISYRLTKMENEFGQNLFSRSNKGIVLTNSGERLLSYSSLMIQYNNEIYQHVTNSGDDIHGNIAIGVTNTFLQQSLAGQLADFHSHYPMVSVNIKTASSTALIEKLRNNELMMVVVRGEKPEGVITTQISEEPLIIISSKPITDEMMMTTPLIRNNYGTSITMINDMWVTEYFDELPPISNISLDSTSRGLVSLVKAGLGWGIISASRYHDIDNLHYKLIYKNDGTPYRYHTYLTYNKDALSFDAYTTYINHLTTYFKSSEQNHIVG